jgi:aryl-alcohol dehydrogenase-like predicted oxidoreductase
MEQRRLGSSGIEVSSFGLGTMMFGAWGNTDRDECHRMVDMALDAGITLFDTADIYDFGVSEEIVGQALAGRRDRVVLATKFGNAMDDDPDHRGGSRRWVRQAVTDSLRRLGTDRIDLYQMHRPDPDVPFDETLGALTELVDDGLIGAIGTSTFPAEQLVEAQWVADRDGRVRPTSEQPPYSILCRGVEQAVLPVCRTYDIGALVWAPLNGGWLTGKYRRDQPPPASSRARARAGPLRSRRRLAGGEVRRRRAVVGSRRCGRRAVDRVGARLRTRAPCGEHGPDRPAHA